MLSRSVMLACVAAAILHGVRTRAEAPCSNPVTRTMEFSVRSSKDRTGRWVAEVGMEHGDDGQESSPWKVDIQHSTVGCPASPTVTLTAKFTAPPLKPGPGYELHRGAGYYKLNTATRKWAEAKATCESEGAHLAIINSEEESKILMNIFARYPALGNRLAYVGFHDMYTEGQFVTIYDEPLSSTGFTRWSKSNTSVTESEKDCGTINRHTGGLEEFFCSYNEPFFCELELA